MKQEAPEVTAARIEAGKARAQMIDRAQDLQARLNPKTLAQNAWEGAKVRTSEFAEDAADAVRERPMAATGVAAAVALFLARKPLWSLVGKLTGRDRPDGEVTVSESEILDMETGNGYYTPDAPELTIVDPVRDSVR